MVIWVKKFIVGFCFCEGMVIGVKVDLCGECMYDFLDKLINVLLLCVCDFYGVSICLFDGCGNYILGVCE